MSRDQFWRAVNDAAGRQASGRHQRRRDEALERVAESANLSVPAMKKRIRRNKQKRTKKK